MRGGGTCPPFKRDIQLQRGEVLKEAPKPSSRTMTGTFQDGGRRGSGHHRKIVSDESLALPQLLQLTEMEADEVLPAITHRCDGCSGHDPPDPRMSDARRGLEQPKVGTAQGPRGREGAADFVLDGLRHRAR